MFTDVLQHPAALHWLWLVAGVGALAWWGLAARRRGLRRFADHALLARLAPQLSLFRPAVRSICSIAGLMLLVLALADPRWGVRYLETEQRGMDVMFVVDVSRSMLAGDASPSRLDRATLFIEDAVDAMAGDRVGLVDFAGDASIRSPLTLNYDAFKTSLAELSPRDTTRGGSMLGDAIRTAAEAFPDDEPIGKAIVVLTDGEDMDSFPVEAAAAAFRDHGARVYTVGIGDSDDGARIPTLVNGQPSWLRYQGAEVWSRMDPELLTEVADAGGGVFVPAGTGLVDLGEFFEDWITIIDQRDRGTSNAREMIPRFRWFAVPALVLLLIDPLISNRRRIARRSGGAASSRRPTEVPA
jgi:Ca-activated chloride channel family protein